MKLKSLTPGVRFDYAGGEWMVVYPAQFVRLEPHFPAYTETVGYIPVVGLTTGIIFYFDGEVEVETKLGEGSEDAE